MIKRLCLVSLLFIGCGTGGEGEKQPPVITEQKGNVDSSETEENHRLFKAHEAEITEYWDKEGRGKWEAETPASSNNTSVLSLYNDHHRRSSSSSHHGNGAVFWQVMLDIWLRYGNGRVVIGGGGEYPIPNPVPNPVPPPPPPHYPAPYPNPQPWPVPPPPRPHYPTCDEYKGAYCWCEDVYTRRRWDGGWCSASVVFGRVGQNGTVCYGKYPDDGRGEHGLPYCNRGHG